MSALLVLLGGALGAPLRYLVDQLVTVRRPGAFPWGTWTVNVVGALLLGALAGAASAGSAPTWLLTFVGTGLCGALTTFSTFSFETVRLAEQGRWTTALSNVGASLATGLAVCAVGYALATALL